MPTQVECQAWTDAVPTTSLSEILSGDASVNPGVDSGAGSLRWIIPIPEDEGLITPCLERLTNKERERADRFRHEGARKQFIVGHGAIHSILRMRLGDAYSSIRWMETEHHKPFIQLSNSSKPLEYNLSHCDGFVAIAIGKYSQGIDIEKHRHLDDLEGISRQVFTPTEIDQVFATQDSEIQHQTFFKFWTCKEAALKADGTGFMKDPKSMELLFKSGCGAAEPVFWSGSIPGYSLAWTERA